MTCPICGNEKCIIAERSGDTDCDCPRCGQFALTAESLDRLREQLAKKNKPDVALLSHLVRRAQRPGQRLQITDALLRSYIDAPPLPKPSEQVENLITWIGDNQSSPEAFAEIERAALAATIGTQISGKHDGALQWLEEQVQPERLFDVRPHHVSGLLALRLTMKGWERYEALRRRISESRTAFMAMKFGEPVLEGMLRDCFKPAALLAGFELRPVNENQPAGLIDNQIRAAIRRCRFVVADLTHGNNGAYFEAGFAEGMGLPVLYTCEKKVFDEKKTHFDTNHMVTIIWTESDKDDAARRLTATIRATLPAEAAVGPP